MPRTTKSFSSRKRSHSAPATLRVSSSKRKQWMDERMVAAPKAVEGARASREFEVPRSILHDCIRGRLYMEWSLVPCVPSHTSMKQRSRNWAVISNTVLRLAMERQGRMCCVLSSLLQVSVVVFVHVCQMDGDVNSRSIRVKFHWNKETALLTCMRIGATNQKKIYHYLTTVQRTVCLILQEKKDCARYVWIICLIMFI